MSINLHYQTQIGLAQYAGARNYRHFLGPYEVSADRVVFGAMIYCLKHDDRNAAILLEGILVELRKEEGR